MVKDLNSTSGTFVNGERVTGTREIAFSDNITLGESVAMPWPPELRQRLAADLEITIGRHANNVVVFTDPGISTFHAKLIRKTD